MEHDQSKQQQAARDARGRLLPGVSGNPAGRPKGLIPSEAKRIRELVEPHREKLIAQLAKIALGDGGAESVKAAEILLGYLAARPRPTAELVYVPQLSAGATLAQKCSAVLDAVAAGEITSTAARELLAVISDVAKIVDLKEIQAKIRAVE
jgi:hypothetical protein